MSGAQAILPAQPSGSPSGKRLPGERSTGEAQRRGPVAAVLGWRGGALVVAEVVAATKEEVLDPRAVEAMEEEVVVVAVVTGVAAGGDHARTLRVGSQSGPTRSVLPLVWGLVPPGVIETPFHHLGAAKSHLHRLIYGVLFLHMLVEHEVGNQRSAYPVTAPAMAENCSFSRASKHRQDSAQRVVI